MQDTFWYVVGFVSSILFIGFLTDALPEYIKLLRLNKIFKFLRIDEFFQERELNPLLDNKYLDFLAAKYWHLFIIRALLCPICLTPIILSLVLSMSYLSISTFPLVYITSVGIYLLLKYLLNK